MNFLILSANPEEPLLSVGGTIARLQSEGHRIFVSILSDGVTSRFRNYGSALEAVDMDAFHDAYRCSLVELGAFDVEYSMLRDNHIDRYTFPELSRVISERLLDAEIDVLLVNSPVSISAEHSAIYKASLLACRRTVVNKNIDVYTFPSQGYSDAMSTSLLMQETPSYSLLIFDISAFADKKESALSGCRYLSQDPSSPLSIDSSIRWTRSYGSAIGVEHAEVLSIVRKTGF